MLCETSKHQFSASGTQKHASWGTLRWKTLSTPSQKQLDGIWEHRLVCQAVCLVECLIEELSLTLRWMNADMDYDIVTICVPFKKKHIQALKRMHPKASIKETTRTLTFNCFIYTIWVHNIFIFTVYMCASSSGEDPGIGLGPILSKASRIHQPRMWKSPSDPEILQGMVSKCICRWPQVKHKTSTKGKPQ